jgi:anti-sigma B factor antagonist
MPLTDYEANCFSATLVAQDEKTQLKIEGELDLATVRALHACTDGLGTNVSQENVVADLSDLTFIDSSGISGLITVAKRLREQGGSFTIANCRRDIRRAFEISGTLEFLTTG